MSIFNPEHEKLEAALGQLRAAFLDWYAAREAQGAQIVDERRSGPYDSPAAFFVQLRKEALRLRAQVRQAKAEIEAAAAAASARRVKRPPQPFPSEDFSAEMTPELRRRFWLKFSARLKELDQGFHSLPPLPLAPSERVE